MGSDEAHLFVLVHGLWGSPTHMLTVEKAIKNSLADVSTGRIVTLKPLSFRFWKTYDGISRCADKVIAEILYEMELLKQKEGCNVTKISIIGYSLGGLISRNIVGKLYELGFFDLVKPVVFCTFATPHVGVHFFRNNIFDKIANRVGKFILGITGFELFLADNDPLLVRMSEPDSIYFKGLECFERRLLLANIKNDRSVAFYTSYITQHSPFDQWDKLKVKYLKDLPSSKIAGITVRPKFVDLERSCRFETPGPKPVNDQEATSLIRRNRVLRWSVIILAASILIPFYIPLVICLSLCVSLYTIVKVKLLKGPDIISHWKDVKKSVFGGGAVNAEHAQRGEDRRKERINLAKHEGFKGDTSSFTETGMENVLYAESRFHEKQLEITSEDQTEETQDKEDVHVNTESAPPSPVESDQLGQEKLPESSESFLSSLLRRKNIIDVDAAVNDSIMKTHAAKLTVTDYSQFPLFTEDTKLNLSSEQLRIVKNLNRLSWDKLAVYHDLFNAHDGIVARRGERTNPKGTSTVYLWVSILRNHFTAT